jgi:hypothetical protein
MRLLPHGTKIGNATVIVDIISKHNPKIRSGRKMNPIYITDHDTGNPGRGADAEMHNRYIHNMASYHPKDTSHVSWHVTVDEHHIYQHIPFDETAYHCGDGVNGPGNSRSIGVEKCMNVDGDRNTTEENAIALYAYMTKEMGIPCDHIQPHQRWSGKYCPAVILKRDGSFNPFRKRIEAAIGAVKDIVEVTRVSNPIVKPIPSINKSNLIVDGYLGKLTIMALQRYFDTPVDGEISKPSTVIKALQKLLGVNADGYLGPITIKAMQKRFGTPVDGVISKPSTVIKELQRRLNIGEL